MLDRKSLETISRLKEALNKSSTTLGANEGSIDNIVSNRGNKLKRSAADVYEGKLNSPLLDRHNIEEIEYSGVRRSIIYKKSKLGVPISTGYTKNDNSESESEDDDPYSGVKIEEILAPIGHPSELPTHPALSHTFTNKTISSLSKRALDVICHEQKHVIQFARLMSVFLGDDPSYILANKLNLPEYDHHWVPEDEEGLISTSSNNSSGSNTAIKEKEDLNFNQPSRRITRNASSQEIDSFFALPQINIDRDFGISAEAAEDTRQLTQIALQRSEEFIRCMTNVRMGLLRAERCKNFVYRWCKEMAEGDTEGQDDNYDDGSNEDTPEADIDDDR
ncbi:hypothetical protein NADFUDRAFT_49125 [Nadsonia fulvescens var. elongata DSM 6958]|uniref:Transcriptional regulatory protein RXT2 N-terminal domain-containing protein n=1 Tax=Nadsonia fulvescens var. elongata DSM 6958 TaxID=857566 RepID=A0A1E3PST6_9ASCO|nr:hypothetical protein NADFUDRAFT_49125 [Nadsonia fulvescens var. elongata DSM 6958]